MMHRTDYLRLVVLEPGEIVVPAAIASQPVAERGPAATVWETQKGIVIPIPETGSLEHPGLEFIRSQGRRIACWLPLTTAHRRVGVLTFGSRSADAYTDDHLAFMDQVAAAVAIAVDNGINFDQAQRYKRELREERDNLRFLLDINNLLVSHLDYAALLEAISEAVQRVIKHEQISLALYDEKCRDAAAAVDLRREAGRDRGGPRAAAGPIGCGRDVSARRDAGLPPIRSGRVRAGRRSDDEGGRTPVGVLHTARHSERQVWNAERRQRRRGRVFGRGRQRSSDKPPRRSPSPSRTRGPTRK